MRYIDPAFIPVCKPVDWDRKSNIWRGRVQAAADKSAELKKIKNPWRLFKDNFSNMYGDKCWYTEGQRIGTTIDVDHFRPKNAVKNISGQLVSRNNAAGALEYASYWWLAYEPLNYRYSCIFSNRANGEGGKQEYFPLESEATRAWTPTCDYSLEDNLFLDPCDVNDVQLIAFDLNEGRATPRYTEEQNITAFKRFEFSKKYYNLNEKSIIDARMKVITELKKDLNILECTWDLDHGSKVIMSQPIVDAKLGIIDKCNRKSPFSAAAVSLVKTKLAEPWLQSVIPNLDLTP
ncbi:hypothetical protein [Pseudoalteromonas sp. JSTW]|uniref:hypothetical protein n=1 Tax=Pseudoalteromonas sp. JSTW TaxID=2752475 RepID=UPI0015D55941|nr:hypothetical protein [Pseudoalteromonas sp. JSTW]QLJ07810.1 hypothetical protein GZH31_13685 [Pseudoalteromonas sp. JSTW]